MKHITFNETKMRSGIDTRSFDEELIALIDELLEYSCITSTQQNKTQSSSKHS